jgi:hypothetical protein
MESLNCPLLIAFFFSSRAPTIHGCLGPADGGAMTPSSSDIFS